ncbi:MAG: hypothetical protein R3E66_20750 [bacterium]
MRNTQMKKMAVLGALVGALAGGIASAQTTSKTTVRTTLSDEISDLEKEVANLSPEEKVDRAVEKIDGMKTTLTETSELLERVRSEERDIQKLNCINEKSAAIKGYVKVSEQSFDGLKQAVTSKDSRAQNHHYTLIAISGQKVTGLGEEARVCAGEVLQYSDGTAVDVILDPEIAEFDYVAVDNGELDFEYIDERLPELTLFQ